MFFTSPHILPLGDTALLVEWGDAIDVALNARVHTLAHWLAAHPAAGFRESVPGYASLVVHFDLAAPVTWDARRAWLEQGLAHAESAQAAESRLIEIPTRYGGEFGPDLAFVAEHNGLTESQVVEFHTGTEYQVYMLGFAPGFAYLGPLPAEIAVPRLDTPRARVPAGSVGLAGRQTGVYPAATPGGWRLVGRTGLRLFDPSAAPPTLLRAGDRVRFVRVED